MTTAIIVTSRHPFGGLTESVFVEPDIRALAERFDRVVIIPCYSERPVASVAYPPNVEVDRFWLDHPYNRSRALRLAFLPAALKHGKIFSEKMPRLSLTFALRAEAFAAAFRRWFRSRNFDLQSTLYISYWNNFAATLAAFMPGLKAVAVDHGAFYPGLPMRARQMRMLAAQSVKRLYAVSNHRREELNSSFGCDYEIRVRYLGCSDRSAADKPHVDDGVLTILTVCRMEPPKRVEQMWQMVRALAVGRTTPVRWIVVGDGSLLPQLRQAVGESTEKNLTVELLGALTNDRVHEIYSRGDIDWAMLLSDSEGGAPIALCEALMHSVPIIGNDAGGISEIVNDDSGLLLPYDPTTEEFVRGIMPMLDSRPRYLAMREAARRQWLTDFNADELRRQWTDELFNFLADGV